MAESISVERFLNSCASWNLEAIYTIVENGFNADSFDDDHVTGLQIAAATGNIEIVKFLLDCGADIEKSNQVGITSLHHACRNGHINVTRILIQRGANYHKLTYLGASVITLAAAGGHLDIVKFLLDLNVNINQMNTALCPTPFIAAAFKRHTPICALLAQKGACIDGYVHRLENLSALTMTIVCGTTSMLTALLELGANFSLKSLNRMTAPELASSLGRNEMMEILSQKSRNNASDRLMEVDLREIIMRNDEATLNNIKMNRMPYLTMPEDATPLMYAVLVANAPIMKTVIEWSSDINAVEAVSGFSSLILATFIGNYDAVKLLLENGADVSMKSFDGLTAIDYAFHSIQFNPDLLCRMYRQLVIGRTGSPRYETLQNFRRTIHNGKSKILNKLANRVPISFSRGVVQKEFEEEDNNCHDRFRSLLQAYSSNDCDSLFLTANDMLRCIAPTKKWKKHDENHNCIRLARTLVEHYSNNKIPPAPIGFLIEDSKSAKSVIHYTKFDQPLSSKASNERRKDFFSLAQRNACIFYDGRYPKWRGQSIASESAKSRTLSGEYTRRKFSCFSNSASGSDGFDKSNFAHRCRLSMERGSTSTLGTTPRMRKRLQEVANSSNDGDSGRSSPSRLSLNQYTFALPEDGKALRRLASTSSIADNIEVGCSSRCTKTDEAKMKISFANERNDYDGSRSRKFTEGYIWSIMKKSGLENYIELFRSEEIDRTTFLALTNNDLLDIGVSNAAHRKTILELIKELHNRLRSDENHIEYC